LKREKKKAVEEEEEPEHKNKYTLERKWLKVERPRGKFQREFVLPLETIGSQASARFENGLLTVVIPKHESVVQTVSIM